MLTVVPGVQARLMVELWTKVALTLLLATPDWVPKLSVPKTPGLVPETTQPATTEAET
ncbi:hypothetical protein L579_3670 [Pantoea sp. AS-PWVM4]|nr:hypothetical protein L579_3670 [Pantoea sp. AS-PWVM4]